MSGSIRLHMWLIELVLWGCESTVMSVSISYHANVIIEFFETMITT